MVWTDEDRHRLWAQQKRDQDARNAAAQRSADAMRARQAASAAQAAESHRNTMRHYKVLGRQNAAHWNNLGSRPQEKPTRSGDSIPSRSSGTSSGAGKKLGELLAAAFLLWLGANFAHTRLGVDTDAGYIAFFIGCVLVIAILYAMRRLIAALLKLAFIVGIIGGVIWLLAHR